MNLSLQQKCDQLVENKNIISNAFKWNSGTMNLAASCLFTGEGRIADEAALRHAEALVKEKTDIFSEFRGNVKVPLLCKIALSDQPEQYFARVQEVYQRLNKSKWMGNEYKILAAMTICDYIGGDDPTPFIEKTNELYERMKKEHKWLTSNEDIPFAAMLAVSGLDTDTLIEEMEKDFTILKQNFRDGNAVQSLSHVLSLDKKPAEEKCEKIFAIFDGLKREKHKYGAGFQLASLGTLTMLDMPAKQIIAEIIEADEYLKGHKGFGSLSLGSDMRRMYAAQMVLFTHMPAREAKDIVLSSTLAFTISLEICMILIMSSITASAASNS